MTDAIDTLLRAADKKSEDHPVAIGQPLSSTAVLPDAPQPEHTHSEQPEPKEKDVPVPNPNKPPVKKDTPVLTAPMLPIPTERHLPSYKKPNAALTFPEKVRFSSVRGLSVLGSKRGEEATSQKSTKFEYRIYHDKEQTAGFSDAFGATCCSWHKC